MGSLAIERLGPEDTALYAGLVIRAWRDAYTGLEPQAYLDAMEEENFAARYHRMCGTAEFYMPRVEGAPAGFLSILSSRDTDALPGTREVAAIYLFKEHWGKGYGRQMMAFGLARLAEIGFGRVTLWVLGDNRRARNFYERYGFVPEGTVQDLHFGNAPLEEMRYVHTGGNHEL